jgi:hypothetical protein
MVLLAPFTCIIPLGRLAAAGSEVALAAASWDFPGCIAPTDSSAAFSSVCVSAQLEERELLSYRDLR